MREFDFYIIPTPIGNIQDITLRAIDILKEVDFIACEDTRITQKLLNHYEIKTKCISYHKYNEKERVDFIISEIKQGKKIALVSDAGTPLICDPGSILIPALIENNITFTSLPGACAVTTFLSHIPRNGEEFTFIGFIERNTNQIEKICIENKAGNVIFYESPERIIKTLNSIQKVRPDAKIALGRELTKLYEEVDVLPISDMIAKYSDNIKGEIVCMIYADDKKENFDTDNKIRLLKDKGYKDKDISIILSTLYNCNKNEVYKRSLSL